MYDTTTMATALNYIPITEVARDLGVHRLTIWKWIHYGCQGRRLRGWKIGKCWYTTAAAIEEFAETPSAQEATEDAALTAYHKSLG